MRLESEHIRPLETSYRGYRFRSRLEARWAVYFDAMHWKWEYEPEGYDLGEAGYYLPDFFLPPLDSWAEVKPSSFTESERRKASALCMATKRDVILLVGVPDDIRYETMFYEEPFGGDALIPGDQHLGHGEDASRAVTAARSARFEFGEARR
jgi:hypothetical protein